MKLSLLFLSSLLSYSASSVFAQETEADSVNFILASSSPETQAIRISNEDDTVSVFTFHFNTGFFFNSEELLEEIRNMEAAFPGEPLERKAWRYVVDNVTYNFPLIENYWQRNPMIMLNSIGFDKCGNQAEMLAGIWLKLGFKTRIWSLKGHIVPEVFINGRWEMYDPSLQVYYKDKAGFICGVEELIQDPALITSPNELVSVDNPAGVFMESIKYSKFISKIYSTTANNKEYTHDIIFDTIPYELEFSLPPKAVFEFPLLLKPEFTPEFSFIYNNYANARLLLPDGWKGDIDIPLAICDLKGSGKVLLNNKKFTIGSPELTAYLSTFSEFNYQLRFDGQQKGIEVIYLINKSFSKVLKKNSLEIHGYNIDELEPEVFNVSPASSLKGNKKMDFLEKELTGHLNIYQNNRAEMEQGIQAKESLPEKMAWLVEYYNRKGGSTPMDAAKTLQKLEVIRGNIGFEKVSPFLEDLSFLIVFTSMLDAYTTEECLAIVQKFSEKQKRQSQQR